MPPAFPFLRKSTPKPEIEERSVQAEWGSSAIPLPGMGAPGPGYFSNTSRYVTAEDAMGIPAVGSAVRLIAETIAGLPLECYIGEGADRVPAKSLPVYSLLRDRPNQEQSAFEFWGDVLSSIETTGNAFIQKIKSVSGRQVLEMHLIDPNFVRCYRDPASKEKRFDIVIAGNRVQGLTSSDILHIRGYTLRGGLVGISPIAQHRHALGLALAAQEYAGRAYANDAMPGMALMVPGNLGRQQALEMLETWRVSHAGLDNVKRPAILTNGADIKSLGGTIAESEAIPSINLSVLEVARIFRIPPGLLGVNDGSNKQTAEEESLRFVRYCILPRIRRVEMSLRTDTDLFPKQNVHPEWLIDELLRADTATRFSAWGQARQAGFMTRNEIRSNENLPPLDGGDERLETPGGGGANASAPSSNQDTSEGNAAAE